MRSVRRAGTVRKKRQDGKRFVNGLLKIQNIVFFTVDF